MTGVVRDDATTTHPMTRRSFPGGGLGRGRTTAMTWIQSSWLAEQGSNVAAAACAGRDYLSQVREVNVSRVGNARRDPARVRLLLPVFQWGVVVWGGLREPLRGPLCT